jgi:hypothetical protein
MPVRIGAKTLKALNRTKKGLSYCPALFFTRQGNIKNFV